MKQVHSVDSGAFGLLRNQLRNGSKSSNVLGPTTDDKLMIGTSLFGSSETNDISFTYLVEVRQVIYFTYDAF